MLRPIPALFLIAHFAWGAQSTTVPLILQGNAPIVELNIQKHDGAWRKARFLIDTGGGGIQIGSQLMADIEPVPAGPAITEDGDHLVPLQPLKILMGNLELDTRDIRCFGLPDSRWTMQRNDVEGILPAALLRKYYVIFDYPARRFTLRSPGRKGHGALVKTPIAEESGFPRIEIEVNGTLYGFLLDTGASFTMISKPVLNQWAELHPDWPRMTGAAGFSNMFGGAMENSALMLRLPEMRIGKFAIQNAAVVSRPDGIFEKTMSDMMTAPIIGSVAGNVLRDFRIEIDYRNGITYLRHTLHSTDEDLDSIGVVMGLANNGDLVITSIASAASMEAKNQLQRTDRLVSIDGKTARGLPLAAGAQLLSGKPGTRHTLTFLRQGKELTVMLSTTHLL